MKVKKECSSSFADFDFAGFTVWEISSVTWPEDNQAAICCRGKT